MPQYNKLLTPKDRAVVFTDHQPNMTFGVANIDRGPPHQQRRSRRKRVAKEFNVPTVLTAVWTF